MTALLLALTLATPAELRAQIEALLGNIDTPVRAAQWQALGPEAAPALRAFALDASLLPSRRAKSIDALALLEDAASAAPIARLARDENEVFVVRLSALRAAARLTPRARVAAELLPVLRRSKDARLRGVAAELMATRAGACDEVRAQAAAEEVAGRHWRAALEACAGK